MNIVKELKLKRLSETDRYFIYYFSNSRSTNLEGIRLYLFKKKYNEFIKDKPNINKIIKYYYRDKLLFLYLPDYNELIISKYFMRSKLYELINYDFVLLDEYLKKYASMYLNITNFEVVINRNF